MKGRPKATQDGTGQRLFRRAEVPQYLLEKHGVVRSYQTLNKLASVGGGPEFVKFGNQPLYTPEAIDHWVAERFSAPRRKPEAA